MAHVAQNGENRNTYKLMVGKDRMKETTMKTKI
jgi:hypothetical protein